MGGSLEDLNGTSPAGQYNASYDAWLGINSGRYDQHGNGTLLPPVPIQWIISPTVVESGTCPSVGATAGAFVASDFLSIILIVILCLPPILKKLTFGLIDNCEEKEETNEPKSSKTEDPKSFKRFTTRWWYAWLIPLFFELMGNIINAIIVVKSKGYEGLSFGNIFLVYATRPRFKVWFFSIFRHFKPGRGLYSAYGSMAFAEIVINLMTAIFVGVTWRKFPNKPVADFMDPIAIWVAVTPVILMISVLLVAPLWYDECFADRGTDMFAGLLLFGTIYAAYWSYWGLFLQLPGSLWCLPQVPGQTAVWTVFSVLATVLSA